MNISGDAKTIAAAFVKACGEMNATVAKDAKGNFGRYATLAAIVEATTGALGRNGLAVVQEAHINDSGVCVDTWLIHESGATMQFAPLTMPLADRKPQGVGSAITYARRYQLAAICGLAPDDDDGQAAQDSGGRAKSEPTPVDNYHVEGDEVFRPEPPPVLSDVQFKQLHALGVTLYGKEEWEVQRPKLVEAVTKGAVSSSKELTPTEADKLIKGITKKINEVEAAKMTQAQPA